MGRLLFSLLSLCQSAPSLFLSFSFSLSLSFFPLLARSLALLLFSSLIHLHSPSLPLTVSPHASSLPPAESDLSSHSYHLKKQPLFFIQKTQRSLAQSLAPPSPSPHPPPPPSFPPNLKLLLRQHNSSTSKARTTTIHSTVTLFVLSLSRIVTLLD